MNRALSTALSLLAFASIAAPAAASWRYEETADAMRGTRSYHAHLYSGTVIDFPFPYQGGSRLVITAAQYPNKPRAAGIAVTKGQFLCLTGGCTVHARFDDGPVQPFAATRPGTGASDILVIRDADRFITQLTRAKRIMIEAPFYKHGAQQATFEASPLTWPPSKWQKTATP